LKLIRQCDLPKEAYYHVWIETTVL
jgi:hypothetical protein